MLFNRRLIKRIEELEVENVAKRKDIYMLSDKMNQIQRILQNSFTSNKIRYEISEKDIRLINARFQILKYTTRFYCKGREYTITDRDFRIEEHDEVTLGKFNSSDSVFSMRICRKADDGKIAFNYWIDLLKHNVMLYDVEEI